MYHNSTIYHDNADYLLIPLHLRNEKGQTSRAQYSCGSCGIATFAIFCNFRNFFLSHNFPQFLAFAATFPKFKEGVLALNFRKLFSEITVHLKVPPDEPIFWSGLEAQDPLAPAWRPCPFSRQKLNFFQKASKS